MMRRARGKSLLGVGRDLMTFGLLLVGAQQSAGAEDKSDVQRLLEQGYYWHSQGDMEMARGLWRKVLLLEPENAEAKHGLQEIIRATAKSIDETRLLQARELSQAGRYREAVTAYRDAFAGEPPSGMLALEYYQTLGGTEDGWAEAVTGLEALSSSYPSNTAYAMALAKLKTYRPQTREDGIRILQQLAQSKHSRGEALPALRQALIWLDARPHHKPLFQSYLQTAPDDFVVQQRLASLDKGSQPGAEGVVAGTGEGALIGNAFNALNRGDTNRAGQLFERVLETNPNQADAMGGLGIVRLRQQRFSQAEMLLARAIETAPMKEDKWEPALKSARYWGLLRQAQDAHSGGLNERARELANQAREVNPTQVDAQLLVADIDAESGNPEGAVAGYRRVLQNQPGNGRASKGLARTLAVQKSGTEVTDKTYGTAATGGGKAGGASTGSQVAQLRREAEAVAMDNPDLAIAKLQDARAMVPRDPWVRLDLAKVFLRQNMKTDAMSVFDDLRNSDDADTLYARALLAAEVGDWAEGQYALDRIPPRDRSSKHVALSSQLWASQQNEEIGRLLKQGDRAQAEAIANAIGERAAGNPQVKVAHAQALAQLGQDGKALAVLQSVKAQDPAIFNSNRLLYADLLFKAGQYDELAGVLNDPALSASKRNSKDLADLRYGMVLRQVEAKRKEGKLAEAYEQLLPLLETQGNQPEIMGSMAALYADAGEDKKSLELYRQLIARDPHNLSAYEGAIGSAMAMRDNKAAERELSEAIANNPGNPSLHAMRGKIYLMQGDKNAAAKAMRQAITQYEATQLDYLEGNNAYPVPGATGERVASNEQYPFGPYRARKGGQKRSSSGSIDDARLAQNNYDEGLPSGGGTAGVRPSEWSSARERYPFALYEGGKQGGSRREPPWVNATREDLADLDAKKTTFVTGGIGVRNRSGQSGLASLTDVSAQINVQHSLDYNQTIGLTIRPTYLEAGKVRGHDRDNSFGSIPLGFASFRDTTFSQRDEGIGGSLYYRYKNILVDGGTTPYGFRKTNFVGGVQWTPQIGNTSLLLAVERRAVMDSLLSFAGARDPNGGLEWGGVTRNGVSVQIGQDKHSYGYYANFAYNYLFGDNVKDNQMFMAGGGTYWKAYKDDEKAITVGLDLSYRSYENNLRHFTIGHGGYFSPQDYFIFDIPMQLSGHSGPLSYRLTGAVGVQHFNEEAPEIFPDHGSLQNQLEAQALLDPTIPTRYPGLNKTGILYGIRGEFEYQLNSNLALGGFAFSNNADNYHSHGVFGYVRYSLAPQTKVSVSDKPLTSGPFYNVWDY